jgi:DNA repair exonuclease SbcCD ATPase subunit
MFEDLRDAFQEALDNFNKELSRDNVSGTADQMLAGMKGELASEKAQVSGLEDQITKTIEHIERLSDEVATARRREEMAREIDDNETVKLAAEFATKAEGYITVLQKKRTALEEELVFRARTVEEMYAQFNAAREKRDSLTATTGRTDARESISAANDLFSQFDRMAEAIEGTKAEAEAAQAFDELDPPSEFRVEIDDAPVPRELDVDAALEELKRRMGED